MAVKNYMHICYIHEFFNQIPINEVSTSQNFLSPNKLKSLKVAQIKDEIDDDEDDGYDGVW